jgi:hypothetical protein
MIIPESITSTAPQKPLLEEEEEEEVVKDEVKAGRE